MFYCSKREEPHTASVTITSTDQAPRCADHAKSLLHKNAISLKLLPLEPLQLHDNKQEIRSVELGVCPMQFFIFDYVTFIQLKICCCVQNFIEIGWLLTRVSILTRDIDIANLSVCRLSVRLSVRYIPVSDENGLTYRQFFHHTVAQSFQFYQHKTFSQYSDGVTPLRGR